MSDGVVVAAPENALALPPVIAGTNTPQVEARVENFLNSVAAIFEAWVNRRKSNHTRRAYRGDVMAFAQFCHHPLPQATKAIFRRQSCDESSELLGGGLCHARSQAPSLRVQICTLPLSRSPFANFCDGDTGNCAPRLALPGRLR
jgi:hypothetical protein